MSIDMESLPYNTEFLHNCVSVVSDETLDGMQKHVADYNKDGWKLISTVHRGTVLILFWERI